MNDRTFNWGFVAGALLLVTDAMCGAEIELNGHRFTLPDGLEIELVARSPLVDRPICADFDEAGRLYVADSSGFTGRAQEQLEKKPHRIVRLVDTDGDGVYDQSTVFADQMMFPEGAMWYDGSLYVGAPPEIWKLTDTDDDGIADVRDAWFDGKTLTGCANDLHGPYLGPDGWIYWCKGAFAEQTYARPGRDPLVTTAAHIFRRHPKGNVIESVMTGGMDNPIEVVFTPGGERVFSTTFLTHPGPGVRDGVIHAVYGGVYGKVHHVLDGHPRTGEIMPVMAHHGGASAPCGLARLETAQLGEDFEDNVLACAFNMRKIIRHELSPEGATFATQDSDLLVSDNLDFHPTDILEDADGSLLVIDTGGWYKVCCPTSRLAKPDILGAIYRIRRTGAHHLSDPRGGKVEWRTTDVQRLITLLGDERHVVRRRARQTLGRRGVAAIAPLVQVLRSSEDAQQRLEAVWALTQNQSNQALAAVRVALQDPDEDVRQAALHSISLRRDQDATPALLQMLDSPSAHNRRAAAEALGRVGDVNAPQAILDALADCDQRVEEHSLIYALIELAQLEPLQAAARDARGRVRRAALIALDQMPEVELESTQVIPLLASDDPVLSDVAWWIVSRHPAWANEIVDYFRQEIAIESAETARHSQLAQRLAKFAHDPAIQRLMGESLMNEGLSSVMKKTILEAMKTSGLAELPADWTEPLAAELSRADAESLDNVVATVHALTQDHPSPEFASSLAKVAANELLNVDLRLQALVAVVSEHRKLDSAALEFLCSRLSVNTPVRTRSLVIDVLSASLLTSAQLQLVADALSDAGPMELRRAVEIFGESDDEIVGLRLVAALDECPAASSLPLAQLQQLLASFGEPLKLRAEALVQRIESENHDKIDKMESVLELVPGGDVRRGERVFHGTKAACISCHGIGYVGGRVGPDLSGVGSIRSERDLVESILFPSLSLVQSFEPEQILTTDGRILTGLVTEETHQSVLLQLDAEKSVRIPLVEIDERQPSTVSVMPDGLDQHLTPQQLADLVAFLKTPR